MRRFRKQDKDFFLKLLDFIFSATGNYLPLLYSFLLLDPSESSKVFLFFSAYTLILGFNRVIIGDHFLLGFTVINRFYRVIFANIFLSGFTIIITLWLSGANLLHSLLSSILILFGSGFGICQDAVRMFGFATHQDRLIIQADLIWLIALCLGFLYFEFQGSTITFENVLSCFFIAALMSCFSLLRIRNDFQTNTNTDASKNIFVYNSKLAASVVLGAGTTHLVNIILNSSIHETMLTDIRGLQLILLPIAFLVGLQQVTWLPKIDKFSSKFEIDWYTLKIFGWFSPFILISILSYGAMRLGTAGYFVGLFLFLDTFFAFLTAQVSFFLRAKKDLSKYLLTRILWSSLTVIFTILAVRSSSIIYVSAGLMSATLLALFLALRILK